MTPPANPPVIPQPPSSAEPPAVAELRLSLLGEPRFEGPGAQGLLSRKDAALLAMLALEAPLARERLLARLWPEAGSTGGANNLRQRVYRLRQDLGHRLIDSGETLRLAPGVSADWHSADTQLSTAQLGAELLAGLDFGGDAPALQAWVRQARNQWQLRRLAELGRRADAMEAMQAPDAALALTQLSLSLDPLDESAWRRLMRLQAAQGQRAAAVASFERCEAVLKDELGLKPSSETLALLAQIEAARPPLGSAHTSWANGPRQALPLVGRSEALRWLDARWAAGESFALIAPGGMGKSRLLAEWMAGDGRLERERARPGDRLSPFETVARLLRRLSSRLGLPPQPDLRNVLSRLLPGLGPALPAPADDAVLHRALVQAFVHARHAGCTFLLIDDAQHVDPASLALLHRLNCEPLAPRVGLAGRPLANGKAPDWLSAPSEPPAETGAIWPVLKLAPLNPGALAELVRHWRLRRTSQPEPLTPDAQRCDQLLRQTLEQTGQGLPLYAVELLRSTPASPGAVPAALPNRPEDLAQHRLKGLSPLATQLARVAAVAGQDHSVELACDVLGCTELDLADAWAELEAREVLDELGLMPHALQDALEASLPEPVRRNLHARVGASQALVDIPPERLAVHHARQGAWVAAAQCAERAAERASLAARYELQIQHLADAVSWFERQGEADRAFAARVQQIKPLLNARGSPQAQAQVLLCRALADSNLRQLALLEADAELAQLSDENERAVELIGLALVQRSALEAQALARDEPAGAQVHALARRWLAILLCQAQAELGEVEAALRTIEPVIDQDGRSDALGAPERLDAWSAYALVLHHANRRRAAVAAFRQAQLEARQCGDWEAEIATLNNLAIQYAALGRLDEAVDAAQESLQRSAPLDHELHRRSAQVNLGMYLAGQCRWAEALALLTEVRQRAEQVFADTAVLFSAQEFLAEIWLLLGRVDRAWAELGGRHSVRLAGVTASRLAFRLDLLARLEALDPPPGADPAGRWAQVLAATEQATPLPTQLRARLHATHVQSLEQALAACEAAHELAQAHEYLPGVWLAEITRAERWLTEGRAEQAWPWAEQAMARLGSLAHPFVPVPRVWRVAYGCAQALGNVGAAQQALSQARRWRDEVARPQWALLAPDGQPRPGQSPWTAWLDEAGD